VYKRYLVDCFFASLRELDPQQAEQLASNEAKNKRTLKDKMLVGAVHPWSSWVTDGV
jgi:hypothetical protein